MFKDIIKGMPNGAEALQDNFKTLGKGIKDVTDEGVVQVRGIEADNLIFPGGVMEKIATFRATGVNFSNGIDGEIYKSGNMYIYNFKGAQMDIKTPVSAGGSYTIDIKVDGTMPTLSLWAVGVGATNATQASIEVTLMTSTSLRIKSVGSGLSTGQYVRVSNIIFFG